MNRIALAGFFLLFLATSTVLQAAPPDLTNGGVPVPPSYDSKIFTITLGPTGLAGWVYCDRVGGLTSQTTDARQFLITDVDSGSPADGLVAVDDVILGADGTGATPANFTYDARKALAAAINDAEAHNPATLKLLRWRAGVTSVVSLTLQTLGSYSATAPYDCPKSALILENALKKSLSDDESAGYGGIGALMFLASDDPSNPDNAARQAKAAATALSLIPSQAQIDKMMNGWLDRGDKPTWPWGHKLVVLAEYYLSTGDSQVLPAIQAIANMLANGADMFGAYGHGFGTDSVPSAGSALAIHLYGPVNSAGLPCFLGMVLAEKCGVATPAVESTIERCNKFYGSYTNRGAIPYGENTPGISGGLGGNGKAGVAALALSLQSDRSVDTRYHAMCAASASSERDCGHSNTYFNKIWNPLGAAAGGEQAASEHFARMHWMLDLDRTWEGGFNWNSLMNESKYNNTPAYRGDGFPMSLAACLTYALPLKKIALTGKYSDPSATLTASELQEVAYADTYTVDSVAESRTNAELLDDMSSFSAAVRRLAALEIASRTEDKGYFLTALTAMVNDPASPGCKGACTALGYLDDPSTIQPLIDLLTCPDSGARFYAGEALRYYSHTFTQGYANQIMDAVIANAKPLLPLDPVDPLQFAQGRLAFLLFYSGNAKGPQGIFAHSLDGIDRNRLYQVIGSFRNFR
jgi:hypothetical protein